MNYVLIKVLILYIVYAIGNTTKTSMLAPVALISDSVEANEIFHWRGSLTTPGCNEAVSWYMFKKPIEISQNQVRTDI